MKNMKIANQLTDLIGKTPLLKLGRYIEKRNLAAEIVVKMESFNPGGSIKDRAALAMIERAEQEGRLKPGMTILEPTSGNTGVGLAMVGAAKGYPVITVMPETMSVERRKLIQAYGAKIVLTPGAKGMQGTLDEVKRMTESSAEYFVPNQFANPANAEMHEQTTAEEIWADTEGQVDVFVAGVGSGGTITGVGHVLKERNPQVHVVAVEPEKSPLLSEGQAGPHKIQGIGANFVPDLLDTAIYDEVVTVSEEAAFAAAAALAAEEGVLAGISSGAALAAATEIAKRPEWAGKRIVVILPDTGERYLSMSVFPAEV